MKLSDYRNTYYEFSDKASNVGRKLAFAGIAIIWIFKIEGEGAPKIPEKLFTPSALLATALAFDLLQYILGTCIWGVFQWYHERTLEDISMDPDLDSPSWLKTPQFICFVLKLFAVFLAYILITKYLWSIVGNN